MRWLKFTLVAFIGTIIIAIVLGIYSAMVAYPRLPAIDALTSYQPKIPLKIYSVEGALIGEFGEERRSYIEIEEVPEALKQAIIAAEDDRFYSHNGIDVLGIIRAMAANFAAGGIRQGASTITQQVARNFFLSREKTLVRKFKEALLAIKIEKTLSKNEILEIYINQIYLGQRAYGFAAASQTYFDKPLEKLSLGEIAMLAGLPKAPSRYNPVANFNKAKQRQKYVLRRLGEQGVIDSLTLEAEKKRPIIIADQAQSYITNADHFIEIIRKEIVLAYQEQAYRQGFKVFTTLSVKNQNAAYGALRTGLIAYDERNGYRGIAGKEKISGRVSPKKLDELLQKYPGSGDIIPAIIIKINETSVAAYAKKVGKISMAKEAFIYGTVNLLDDSPANRAIEEGAVIFVQKYKEKNWKITQIPEVEGALISIDANTGGIRAMVGGFDYKKRKFNHATQAYRQPGSSFKPFIYSAALSRGFSPATIITDAPITIDPRETGDIPWEPKNYDGKFNGPMRLRTALTKSKNLVSVRIIQAITPKYARDYLTRFGIDPKRHPPYLTMALGAGTVTPQELAMGYAVFANGGYRIIPHFIERIENSKGEVLAKANYPKAGDGAMPVIDPRNAFLMFNMMQDVIRGGTGRKALALGRIDLAGKTGTTNDQMDAWFAGFQKNLVAVTWMGYDIPKSLGQRETGAVAALPIWMSYMGEALKGEPEELPVVPDGIKPVAIDPLTGLHDKKAARLMIEYFLEENTPELPTKAPETQSEENISDIENEVY